MTAANAPRSDRTLMIVLAYLWPLALIPLIAARDHAETAWHARHGLVLMAAEAVVLAALVVISGIASLGSFGVGCVVSMFIVFAVVAILAIHAFAIFKALNGGRLHVPGVTDLVDRLP